MTNHEKVLLDLVAPIIEDKADVSIKVMPTLEDSEVLLYVYVNSDDVARLIGRRSMMVFSTHQMMSVVSREEDKRVIIKSESCQDAFRVLSLGVGHMRETNIGMFMNTHGLHGEIRVKVLMDFPQLRFQEGAVVYLQLARGQFDLKIQHVQESRGQLLIKSEGYDDINQVEGWKDSMLTIREEKLQELDESEAYFHELQDAVIYDMGGAQLGTVSEIVETGANAIPCVKVRDRDILVPLVRAFVKEFDRKSKMVKVELMKGLV